MRPPKLSWDAIGFKKKTIAIVNTLNNILDKIPVDHTGKRKTPETFLFEFENIIKTIKRIDDTLIPYLEENLRIEFKTQELIYLAMAQTSLSSLYSNFGNYINTVDNFSFKEADIKSLSGSGETSKVLALLGDAALDLAVVETHWETSVDRVGSLTRKRSELVKNENLARICDEWGLYEYRLRKMKTQEKSKPKEVEHLKGTLIEAIIGVIYMENDQRELVRILPYLL